MNKAVKPFCFFATCIWQSLLEYENALSPVDAYALGVVDEVYDSKLPSLREAMESQTPNQPELPPRPLSPQADKQIALLGG